MASEMLLDSNSHYIYSMAMFSEAGGSWEPNSCRATSFLSLLYGHPHQNTFSYFVSDLELTVRTSDTAYVFDSVGDAHFHLEVQGNKLP